MPKRVVAFVDTYDTVPDKARYLFSKEHSGPATETDEEKSRRIIDSNAPSPPSVYLYTHYYEVDEEDFAALMANKEFKAGPLEKIKAFAEKFNLITV